MFSPSYRSAPQLRCSIWHSWALQPLAWALPKSVVQLWDITSVQIPDRQSRLPMSNMQSISISNCRLRHNTEAHPSYISISNTTRWSSEATLLNSCPIRWTVLYKLPLYSALLPKAALHGKVEHSKIPRVYDHSNSADGFQRWENCEEPNCHWYFEARQHPHRQAPIQHHWHNLPHGHAWCRTQPSLPKEGLPMVPLWRLEITSLSNSIRHSFWAKLLHSVETKQFQ